MLVFRDPPPVEARADELKREIARILVNAPTVPVELPRFGLQLHEVEAQPERPDRIGLRLRKNDTPLATVFLEWPEAAPSLQASLRWDGGDREAPTHALLNALLGRLKTAIDAKRWAGARAQLERLNDLPRNVPMSAFRHLVPGVHGSEGLVRTGFGCNQDCGLCWQGRSWGRVDAASVLTWIEDLREGGAESLIISGGEPTLDPDLPRYIARGRELGFRRITLETNAIQFAKRGQVERVKTAGLDEAFVSLHSGDAEVSDLITRAPGTHARTVRGIQALLEGGVAVTLNAVITTESISTVAALPDFIHASFGAHANLNALVVSDAGDAFEKSLIPKLTPHPDRMREVLPKLIERAIALGIKLEGLGGACGPHLCLFGADTRVVRIARVASEVDFRQHLPACERCAVKHACLGVRSAHVGLYGEACVRPLDAVPASR